MKKVFLILIIFLKVSSFLSQKSLKIIFSVKDNSLEYKKMITNNIDGDDLYSVIIKVSKIPIKGNNISLDIAGACICPAINLKYKRLSFKKNRTLLERGQESFETVIINNFNKIKYIYVNEDECYLDNVEIILKSLN